jgi:hypothetical protein
MRWGLGALLLALTSLLWAAEAPYAGPSARAADAWTNQSHSVTARFLAWARASGRGVPDQVWVLTGASADALRQWDTLAADRPRGGPVMPAEEGALCRFEVPGFPDFESLCRARFGHLRWQRVANILSAGTWKYPAGKASAEATWMDGALRAARSQQKVHVAGRAVWIALPTVEAQEANCSTECAGVLALADALSRLWQRDAGSDGESVLGETIPGAWPPNSSTWQRIRAVKAALTAAAFLGISPAPLLRDYARYAKDLPSRRRIERAAGKLEALLAGKGREWALSPDVEAQIAVRIGIAVLIEELPPDLPSGAEDQAMAARFAAIAARRSTDNSAPEVQFFDWLEQRELDMPPVADLPDTVTGKTLVCSALAPFDPSGLLRHACEYRQFSERIRAEHDLEMLDHLRNRRVFELKG